MKNLIVLITALLAFGCALPEGENHSGDQAALALPPATWGQVYNECVDYCLHVYSYHCAETMKFYWFPQCRSGCFDLADTAEDTGCTAQAVDWMECEQTQLFQCWGAWPYQLTDYCSAEGDTYTACRSDS